MKLCWTNSSKFTRVCDDAMVTDQAKFKIRLFLWIPLSTFLFLFSFNAVEFDTIFIRSGILCPAQSFKKTRKIRKDRKYIHKSGPAFKYTIKHITTEPHLNYKVDELIFSLCFTSSFSFIICTSDNFPATIHNSSALCSYFLRP